MLNTLLHVVILDDSAYKKWRERPNLFLRGIVLIAVVTLVAGLIVFAVDLVNRVQPVDAAAIEKGIRNRFEQQYRWNPAWQNTPPEVRQMMDDMIDVIVPMVTDLASVEAPLPRGISGFFQALGAYLSRVLAALGGWMFYGSLVLVVVNLLGGSAKLPHFLGMTSLYAIPGLLGLLQPIPCVGSLLVFVATIWSIIVYVKAVSVASELDLGRSVIAVLAPFLVILLLSILLGILFAIWLAIVI
jgi:hypothetical protein